MFMKKLVERAASRKQQQAAGAGDGISGLRSEEVHPRLTFHHGVPSAAASMAYDPIQHILAIATKDGRIKFVGRDNTQALLQSEAALPSKFLQFLENQGILLNVNIQDHIEVWDLDKKQLCHTYINDKEITSFTVVQQTSYMYIGDCSGNISVVKLNLDIRQLASVDYAIPFSESHGGTEVGEHTAVICIMPQPMAESKRVLIIFKDGLIGLWGIQESKMVFISGGIMQYSSHYEQKKVTAACWACPFGTKVAVGYKSGDIFLWAVPVISDPKTVTPMNKRDLPTASNIPLFKLNLGYKMDKIPIISLRWVVGDGRASRLYVNGFSDHGSYSFQVIILNEHSESRTIKLALPLSEECLGMEIISCSGGRNKMNQNALALLLKSGNLCLYDDSEIENYLSQCQSKSSSPLPSQLMVKLRFGDSLVTAAKHYAGNPGFSSRTDEEHILLANKYSHLLSLDSKDVNYTNTMHFGELTKTKGLYITGHIDGTINFWDASCPLLIHLLSIENQTKESNKSSGSPVTALHFDIATQLLVCGDKNGTVFIITFKKEQTASENIISFIQAKQGCNHTIRSVKLTGSILSINTNANSKYIAAGTERGFVSVIDMESTTILYQKQFPSQLYSGVISLQFEICIQNGYEKNILLVGMEDSSVVAIEEDTGNALNADGIHTTKPSRALLVQIIGVSSDGVSSSQNVSNDYFNANLQKQSLLMICSEDAVRLYSFSHMVQGIKKLYCKKQLSGTCCFASLVYSPSSSVGLMLIFCSGKIEIRSLPDLALLNETSIRGFVHPTVKLRLNAGALCTSSEGEFIAVNGDKEMFFFSVLSQKDTYRYLDNISQVYKGVIDSQGHSSVTNAHKEKKKGIFGIVVKDLKGNKSKNSQESDLEDSGSNIAEELSAIFHEANTSHEERRNSSVRAEDDAELDIDDIDLEDIQERPKEQNFSILSKKKLGKKFQAIKGRLIPKTDEKGVVGKETHEDEKTIGAVDQLKKKYGYSMNNDSTVANMAENKLRDNVKKLESIGMRASEMQNSAQSFATRAKELLRTVQKQ